MVHPGRRASYHVGGGLTCSPLSRSTNAPSSPRPHLAIVTELDVSLSPSPALALHQGLPLFDPTVPWPAAAKSGGPMASRRRTGGPNPGPACVAVGVCHCRGRTLAPASRRHSCNRRRRHLCRERERERRNGESRGEMEGGNREIGEKTEK